MITAILALLAILPTPPGTLITLSATNGGVTATSYLVVKSPVADKIGIVYICGSYRGNPLPGIQCRLIAPISPGEYITVDGWALTDGRVLVGNIVVDPKTIPP